MRQSSTIFQRLARALTRPATRLLLAGSMLLSIALVARSTVPVLVIAVLAVAAAGLVGVVLTLAGYDADADHLAARLIDGDVERRLVARWMERARWARFVGGLAGVIVWLIGFQTQADLLVCGSVGICAGAVLAEAHHLRRPSGPRTARLEVRSLDSYLARTDARRMLVVGACAAAVAVVGLVVDASTETTIWACAAIATIGVVHLAQRRVASRGRPAVSDELRRADDLARSLAIGNGLARPATYAALAMLARALFELGDVIAVAGVLGIAAWFFGAGMWWRNRRLGLASRAATTRQVALA